MFTFITLFILTGSAPAQAGPYDNHPILRLFSREKEETIKDTTQVIRKKQQGIQLQIWTGSGTIAQQSLFTFSDETTIDRNRENLNWWFRLKTEYKSEFAVWQVSESPFSDNMLHWKEPEGLVASGPVISQFDFGNTKLFDIAFDQFVNRKNGETSEEDIIYYIRVIPLNAIGEPAGFPSNTVMAHYTLPP